MPDYRWHRHTYRPGTQAWILELNGRRIGYVNWASGRNDHTPCTVIRLVPSMEEQWLTRGPVEEAKEALIKLYEAPRARP